MFEINSITTLEECTKIRTYLQRKKSDISFEKTQLIREEEGTVDKASAIPGQITVKTGSLQNFQSQLAALPAGPSKQRTYVETEIKRLEVQIEDLNRSLEKHGIDEVFEAHVEGEFSDATLAVIDTYLPLVDAKFVQLGGVAA